MDALPKVYRLATEPVDVLVSSVAAILCSAPDRINEALILPDLCEVHQSAGSGKAEAYGLRWWPAKGADPMVKWIVPSMASVVEEAIGKIRSVTHEARQIAKWYEDHPGKIYLHEGAEHLRDVEWLMMSDVASIIGVANAASAVSWCTSRKLELNGRGASKMVRFVDIETVVISMLPAGFPFLEKETGLRYCDALLVVRTKELNPQKGTCCCMIEPISIRST